MRHHTAAPLTDGSGYHYASVHRSGGYPLGYCAEHAPHPTEDDARRCYRQWQRDHVRLGDRTWSWTSCDARPCDNPARRIADIEGDGYAMAALCDEHWTREDAIRALHLDGDLAGDAWQS